MIDFSDFLNDNLWAQYLENVESKGNWTKKELSDLKDYVQNRDFREPVEKIISGKNFNPPVKHLISKTKSGKKRTVYSYSQNETYVLKLLSWKLHEYDYLFCDNLYSFRKNMNPQKAFAYLNRMGAGGDVYSYKVDISNYFNSIPIDKMIAVIEKYIDNAPLCDFFRRLLENPQVVWEDELITEEKGIMAGTPTASFLANLYLAELDRMFFDSIYVRYSDDIILFAKSEAEREQLAEKLLSYLHQRGLSVNAEKECRTAPGEPWTFLGITRKGEISDISEISLIKLKAKLHRRARAIERWKRKKGATDLQAARAYIKAINRKLFDNPKKTELTWCRWYFPLINTDKSLKEIEHYIQSNIRYAAFGNYGKKTYNLRYEDMKALGYKSLLHEYYSVRDKKDIEN